MSHKTPVRPLHKPWCWRVFKITTTLSYIHINNTPANTHTIGCSWRITCVSCFNQGNQIVGWSHDIVFLWVPLYWSCKGRQCPHFQNPSDDIPVETYSNNSTYIEPFPNQSLCWSCHSIDSENHQNPPCWDMPLPIGFLGCLVCDDCNLTLLRRRFCLCTCYIFIHNQ